MNIASTSSVGFLSAMADLSMLLKIAWVIIVVWLAVQVIWYRRIRVVPAAPAPPPAVRKPRRRVIKKKQPEPAPSGPLPEVVTDLDPSAHVIAAHADTVYR